MSLPLPIYLLGSSYYLHTRVGGKQVKRSLRTSYKRVAIILRLPLNFGALSPGFMRRSCAEPPASVARIAWG